MTAWDVLRSANDLSQPIGITIIPKWQWVPCSTHFQQHGSFAGIAPPLFSPFFHFGRMKIPILRNTFPIRSSTTGFPGNLAIEYNNKIAFVYPVYGKQNKASPSARTAFHSFFL